MKWFTLVILASSVDLKYAMKLSFFVSLSLCLVMFQVSACTNTAQARSAAAQKSSPPTVLHVDKSTITVSFTGGDYKLPRTKITEWIHHSAIGVSKYFGGFPVQNLRIVLSPSKGTGISYAETFPRNGSEIKASLGVDSTEADLKSCWMLTHEMVHLGFPFTDDNQDWATEGLATYCEAIIREQIGEQTKSAAWADLKKGMPQGLPQAGDRGLDNTRTWGRVYWGGAIFYLLADIQIRTQTHNKLGLPDALKGIVKKGGNIESQMTLKDTFEAGDAATNTRVLTSLYNQTSKSPTGANLDEIWKWLGISGDGEQITLDHDSPLSRLRSAIETGRAQ